jgi:hypothetical protein
MASTVHRSSVDLAARPAHPVLALALALLSIPGSTLAWDALPGGGYVFGFPVALAAVVLGVQALRRSPSGRAPAVAAVVIGAAMLVMMLAWPVVDAL